MSNALDPLPNRHRWWDDPATQAQLDYVQGLARSREIPDHPKHGTGEERRNAIITACALKDMTKKQAADMIPYLQNLPRRIEAPVQPKNTTKINFRKQS